MNLPEKISPEFAKALVQATAQIKAATKDAENPHFKSRYADLSSIIEAVRKPLSDNGLTFLQRTSTNETGQKVFVETILIYQTGELLSLGACLIPMERPGPQGFGSALTYGRRYTLAAALGVPTIDDDGEAAEGRGEALAAKTQPKQVVAIQGKQGSLTIESIKSKEPMTPGKPVTQDTTGDPAKAQFKPVNWLKYPYRYNLPFKESGKDWAAVREELKNKKLAIFNKEDKCWYAKIKIEQLAPYELPLEPEAEAASEAPQALPPSADVDKTLDDIPPWDMNTETEETPNI
jgi:hypothetical protein